MADHMTQEDRGDHRVTERLGQEGRARTAGADEDRQEAARWVAVEPKQPG